MTVNKPFGALAIITAVGVLGITSAAASDIFRGRGGHVMPCSLAGINPAYHPDIFGSPVVARSYGFVRSPNGAWQVASNCRR